MNGFTRGFPLSQSSTLFTVGTLLRHAQDAGAPVRLLVSGVWLDGVIAAADGLGVILDDGAGMQVLVRLDSILAVTFSRSHIDHDAAGADEQSSSNSNGAHAGFGRHREPIEAGPVGG